jgi:hypothetical protein
MSSLGPFRTLSTTKLRHVAIYTAARIVTRSHNVAGQHRRRQHNMSELVTEPAVSSRVIHKCTTHPSGSSEHTKVLPVHLSCRMSRANTKVLPVHLSGGDAQAWSIHAHVIAVKSACDDESKDSVTSEHTKVLPVHLSCRMSRANTKVLPVHLSDGDAQA